MALWIGIVILLLVVAGGLSLALYRRRSGVEDRRGHLLEVYRAQLDEVERDLSRGLIDEAAAEAAKTEVARRILKLEEEPEEAADGTGGRQKVLAPLLGLVVAGAALALYLQLGSPETPSRPFAGRADERAAAQQRQQAQAPLLEMERQLSAQLEQNPENAQGQYAMAQVQLQLGRPGRAVSALRRAVALSPDTADYRAALGEALILANNGRMTPEARAALEQALELDEGNPRADFFLAMGLVEEGRREEGLERLIALLRRAPADAPWRGSVLQAAQGLAADLGRELPQDVARAAPSGPAPGPNALEGMGEEQQAMIGQMVEGLAARLEEQPDDLEGWQRLARSYEVLGQRDKAAGAKAQIARLRPDSYEAQMDAGLSLVEAGRAEGQALAPEAEAYFRRALELDPETVDARFFLGEYAFQRGEREQAREYWTPLLDILPADSEIGGFLRQRLEQLEG